MVVYLPFALSLSKGLQAHRAAGGFDRLSPNGWVIAYSTRCQVWLRPRAGSPT
jgi:hypothetical protein